MSIADAATARIVVRVLDASETCEDNVMGEVELSMSGIVAAEKSMAAASAAALATDNHCDIGTSGAGFEAVHTERATTSTGAGCGNDDPDQRQSVLGADTPSKGKRTGGSVRDSNAVVKPTCIKPCGLEAWFPLFVAGRHGGNRDREVAGEVRLSFRFLSTNFMLQRELTAGADEGDNGPIGVLRYALERRPGRLFVAVRCCQALRKAMIGDRAPLVEATLRPGGWECSTRRQAGLNPIFNENMATELLWTPQDFNTPELILEVKDKALGGGCMAVIRVAVAPFILHPRMPAEIWYPLRSDGEGGTNSGIFCGLVYIPSMGGVQTDGSCATGRSIEAGAVSLDDVVDSELTAVAERARSGVVHVQVISARGLPASSKDPQVGVRLRVRDHQGSVLPPFQRTAAVRGGRGEPRFDSTFLLSLRQDEQGIVEQTGGRTLGRTPVLEMETRCARGRSRVLGTVEIPIFPLWLMGHMTRTWYPMRSADGEGEAGSVFVGLQFLPDGETRNMASADAQPKTAHSGKGVPGKRRFLFIEVRQGRDFCGPSSISNQDATVHVEMLRSGARTKTPPARNGGTDPEWRDGAGLLALPYQSRGRGGVGRGQVSEVLRITAFNVRYSEGGEGEESKRGGVDGDRLIGQCDWPLPVEDLDSGCPISAWHALWTAGSPAGDVYLRCRVGYEGETLDHTRLQDTQIRRNRHTSMSPLASGNYHVEFLQVRGLGRTLQRRDVETEGAVQWVGKAYLAAAPGATSDSDDAYGAPTVAVASGQAVAVGTCGRSGSGLLCVQISTSGESVEEAVGASDNMELMAMCTVPREKLQALTEVPGSELLEWFPLVAIKDGGRDVAKHRSGEADTGQVLISVRYAPLAVGVLEVSMCEFQLVDDNQSRMDSGKFKALTRLLPAQTGAGMGHKVRSTPGRRGFRRQGVIERGHAHWRTSTGCSWEDAPPHRMRFNNTFNNRPTTLHVSVVQGDMLVGFASVAVEKIVQNSMSTIARELEEGGRTARGCAHDLGPVGLREGDFGDPNEAWYALQAPSKEHNTTGVGSYIFTTPRDSYSSDIPLEHPEVGRIRISIRFAPHPKALLKNWQEGAAVARAQGVAAMKAVFYRLNRSGNLVVEKDDLRIALIHAVQGFLATSRVPGPGTDVTGELETVSAGKGGGTAQAGEFVVQMTQAFPPSQNMCMNRSTSGSAVDQMFTMIERDRTAEVTFSEFCGFLSKASARQAEAAVGNLVAELAEDNDDGWVNVSEDDIILAATCPTGDAVELYGQEVAADRGEKYSRAFKTTKQDRPTSDGNERPTTEYESGSQSHATMKHISALDACVGSQETFDEETIRGPGRDPGATANTTMDSQAPEKREDFNHLRETMPDNKRAHGKDRIAGRSERAAEVTVYEKPRPTGKLRLPNDAKSWAVRHVLLWLDEKMQLPQYVGAFRQASIDGLVLLDLTDDLLRDAGVPDPLHRLKLMRHVQELSKRQYVRDQRMSATLAPKDFHPIRERDSSPPWNSIEIDEPTALNRAKRPRNATGYSIRSGQPRPPLEGARRENEPLGMLEKRGEKDDGIDGPFVRHAEQAQPRADPIPSETDVPPSANELEFKMEEEAFAHVMDEVHSDVLRETRRSTTSFWGTNKRMRRVPANATISEVCEVIKKAMWETAAALEYRHSAGSNDYHHPPQVDDYPPAWWGSSVGGSVSGSENADHKGSVGEGITAGRERRASNGASLLFDEFLSHQLRGKSKSPRTDAGICKLTRHRLEAGIRSLLSIEMRWEQFDLFLSSISNLRTRGYLSRDEFAQAFAFPPALLPGVTFDSTSSRRGQPETMHKSMEFDSDNGYRVESAKGIAEGEETEAEDVAGLREYVLGMADTLRACRSTLEGVIADCDRRGVGKVSKSSNRLRWPVVSGESNTSTLRIE